MVVPDEAAFDGVMTYAKGGNVWIQTDDEARQLTDTGRDIVATTLKKRDAWLTTRLRELSKEDRAALARAAELMGDLATL